MVWKEILVIKVEINIWLRLNRCGIEYNHVSTKQRKQFYVNIDNNGEKVKWIGKVGVVSEKDEWIKITKPAGHVMMDG